MTQGTGSGQRSERGGVANGRSEHEGAGTGRSETGRSRSEPTGGERSEAGDALADVALSTFRLNDRLLEAAEQMTRPAGLTAAWWQVLGAVLREPLPVSGIARSMGITRQSVQRIADLLVDKGLAEYRPNPAHRRAKLLQPTEAGRAAIRQVAPDQHAWAERLAAEIGLDELKRAGEVLHRLIEAVEAVGPRARDRTGHRADGRGWPPAATGR